VNVIGTRQNGGNANTGKQAAAEHKAERKDQALDKLGAAVSSLTGGANLDIG